MILKMNLEGSWGIQEGRVKRGLERPEGRVIHSQKHLGG